jgi:hypothetical protein
MRRRREPVHQPNQYATASLVIPCQHHSLLSRLTILLTGPTHQIQWWCQFEPARARPIARAGFIHAPVYPGAIPVLAHVTSPKLKPTSRGPRVRPYRTCCRGSNPVPTARKLVAATRQNLCLGGDKRGSLQDRNGRHGLGQENLTGGYLFRVKEVPSSHMTCPRSIRCQLRIA